MDLPITADTAEEAAERPWGAYRTIAKGGRYRVKRIDVTPGQALSLQKHHHRAEHWIVVAGTAEVTVDAEVKIVPAGQNVFLPLGCVHRLMNPGKVLMTLIEVQIGEYLEEDDIIRLEDRYGRAPAAKP